MCVGGSLPPGCVSGGDACGIIVQFVSFLTVNVCVCVHCVAGGICVVLFVLKVFPHSDPRGGSRTERHTEREKEGERVPLLSPHTHTLIILSGN